MVTTFILSHPTFNVVERVNIQVSRKFNTGLIIIYIIWKWSFCIHRILTSMMMMTMILSSTCYLWWSHWLPMGSTGQIRKSSNQLITWWTWLVCNSTILYTAFYGVWWCMYLACRWSRSFDCWWWRWQEEVPTCCDVSKLNILKKKSLDHMFYDRGSKLPHDISL